MTVPSRAPAKALFGVVLAEEVVLEVSALVVLLVVVPKGLLVVPEVEPNGRARVAVLVLVPVPVSPVPTLPTGTLSEVGIPIPLSGFRSSSGIWCVVPELSTQSASKL